MLVRHFRRSIHNCIRRECGIHTSGGETWQSGLCLQSTSLVFYHFVTASSSAGLNSSGKMLGLWDVSTMAFTCVVATVNLHLLLMCNSITRWHHVAISLSILAWFAFLFICSLIRGNLYHVSHVIMSTIYFYLTFLLVPIVTLLGDFLWQVAQRWFFPYDYQIIHDIHRHEPDDNTRAENLQIRNHLTPDQERRFAISLLSRETSKHTGFAFDSPGYESFFALQQGVAAPQKAWDVVRRASMRTKSKTLPKKRTFGAMLGFR